jgi:hypothetical protein
MTKKRRNYLPGIVGDKVMMPADLTHQSDRQYPMQRGFGRSCSSCRRLKT